MEGNTTEPAKTQPPLAKTPPATAKGHSTGTSVAKTSTVSTSKPVTQATAKPVKVKNETAAEPVKKTETGPFRIFLLSWPLKMDRNAGQLGLIGDITEEKIDEKYHYFTGQYKTREEAEKMLPEIRNLGFRTAAIVPAGGR